MKTPDEIKKYRNCVIDVLKWALEQGHIEKEQYDTLKEAIENIELELYPKEMVKDENGWLQIKSDYVDGLPFDEWK